ncbi:MAG: nucleotidyltransferase family protein [Acidobacteriota bacterium]
MPHRDNGVVAERQLERLIACLPEWEAILADLADEIADWSALLTSSQQHGLEDYLFRRLIRVGVPLPEATLTRFRLIQVQKAVWTLQLTTQMERILDVLQAAGIAAIPLKGPLLGERLYGGGGLRSSSDLDVLIPYQQVHAALAALAGLGYQTNAATIGKALADDHNIALDNISPPLELHFHLFRRFGVTLRGDDFLARAVPYRTQRGRLIHTLAPEDEFLFLCVHAAAHSFVRLAWLFDLKLLLNHHSGFDWEILCQRAQDWRVTTAVVFACELLRQRLGVKTPLLSCLTARQRWWLQINQQLFDQTMRRHNLLRRSLGAKLSFFLAANLYQSSLHDSWQSRLRFLGLTVLRALQRQPLAAGEV